MAQHHLPAGCHDAETAAKLLHMSKRALLAKLREMGWLNTGGGQGNHNLPRRDYTKNGYLCTQDRGFCLKGKKEISKTYRVMLLTQIGFNALKSELEKSKVIQPVVSAAPEVAQAAPPAALKPAEEIVVPFNRESADAEYKKAMDQFRELGIAS